VKTTMSAAQVIDVLKKDAFRTPAHAWLHEVRNQTGYGRQVRSADALVTSLWPSRGVWFAGVEVKVSATDWKKELDDPSKAAEIQRFCDYWYVAAPAGVIKLAQVPERWGFYEVAGGKATLVKEAPRLTPEPLTAEFVASVIRNASSAQANLIDQAKISATEATMARVGTDAVTALQEKLSAALTEKNLTDRQLEFAKRDLASLRDAVRMFENSAGLPPHTIGNGGSYMGRCGIGEQFKVAAILARLRPRQLAEQLRDIAHSLEAVEPAEAKEVA